MWQARVFSGCRDWGCLQHDQAGGLCGRCGAQLAGLGLTRSMHLAAPWGSCQQMPDDLGSLAKVTFTFVA